MRLAPLQEEGLVGIVDEVVEQRVHVHSVIGNVGTFVSVRIHADGSTVDDHVILLHHLGSHLFITYGALFLAATHKESLQTQRLQTEIDGFRRAASTQYQRLLVAGLQHGLYTLGETYHIAVEPLEDGLAVLVGDADDIDCTNGIGLRTNGIQIFDDLLFVGNGHIEPLQLRIGVENLGQRRDVGDFVVLVHGIDALVLEFLIEISYGERVS